MLLRICLICYLLTNVIFGQIDSSLFQAEDLLKIEFRYDQRQLRKNKYKDIYLPSNLQLTWPNGELTEGQVGVKPRGNFRRRHCQYAPLKVDFSPGEFSHPQLAKLKSIKLVCPCQPGDIYQQYIFQEYLVYKVYQLFTSKSFKVRLAEFTFQDTRKDKNYTQIGFFIEDIDELAERNNCYEFEPEAMLSQYLDQDQLKLMSLFQFMVGNGDWYIGNLHNLKLIKIDDFTRSDVYPIPYDFDYTGMVNARYAIPNERIGTTTVRERIYLGPCWEEDELQNMIARFLNLRSEIFQLYEEQSLLSDYQKRQSIQYLEEFYQLLEKPERLIRILNATCKKP